MAEEPLINLKVKTLQPATHEVAIPAQATVRQLKEKLHDLTTVPADRQRLIFRGVVLQDTQSLAAQRLENGHVLHLVERSMDQNPGGAGGRQEENPPEQQQQQQFVGVVQIVTVADHTAGGPGPHQLTALNNFLLQFAAQPAQASLPPYRYVARTGQLRQDEAAFIDVARAALNGVDLPDAVQQFVQDMAPAEREPQPEPAANLPSGLAAPPQTPGQPQPRPQPMSAQLLRLSTLAVSQIARQALVHVQAQAIPTFASAVQRLRHMGEQEDGASRDVYESAQQLSSLAHNAGSLLLELSLAAANLAQGANGNAGPLLAAQTGFLAPDGTHTHVTNRIPGPMGPMQFLSGGPVQIHQAPPGGRPGNRNSGPPRPEADPAGGVPTGAQPQRPQQSQAAPASPLALAFFNAISDDETRTRHMRLPVRLLDGTSIRLDLSSIVNCLETLILSVPTETLVDLLSRAMQGAEAVPTDLTELMSMAQSDEQRRFIFLQLVQPVLQASFTSLNSYFQQVYRVDTGQSRGEQASSIRPTRRAASRSVPSLTQPFAVIPNPARDMRRPAVVQPHPGGLPPGPPVMDMGNGAQMRVEMSVEGSIELPASLSTLLGMQNGQNASAQTSQPPAASTTTFRQIFEPESAATLAGPLEAVTAEPAEASRPAARDPGDPVDPRHEAEEQASAKQTEAALPEASPVTRAFQSTEGNEAASSSTSCARLPTGGPRLPERKVRSTSGTKAQAAGQAQGIEARSQPRAGSTGSVPPTAVQGNMHGQQQVPGGPSGSGSGQGLANVMARMLQSPGMQQFLGSAAASGPVDQSGSRPRQPQSTALPGPSVAHRAAPVPEQRGLSRAAAPADPDLAGLNSLPHDSAQHWRDVILSDRRRCEQQAPAEPLSKAYRSALVDELEKDTVP